MPYNFENDFAQPLEKLLNKLRIARQESIESPGTDAQQPQPTICPWFIHGSNCANYLTTLKCYKKPCSFDRGKQ